jgi:predicted nuclease with TOPRIM domain
VPAPTPPQELEFNIRIENLRQKVEEVNAESSVLLHERVKHIEEKEEKLLEEVAQLKTQNGDLLQGNEALRRQTKTLEAQNNELKAKLDSTCVTFTESNILFTALIEYGRLRAAKRLLGAASI